MVVEPAVQEVALHGWSLLPLKEASLEAFLASLPPIVPPRLNPRCYVSYVLEGFYIRIRMHLVFAAPGSPGGFVPALHP